MDASDAQREPVEPISPLSTAILTLGDQWNLLILQLAFLKRAQHFSEWRDDLGLSESILTDRLRELLAADILTAAAFHDGTRHRSAYRLTDRGLSLWQFLVAIWAWETRWVDGRAQWPGMRHVACGEIALPDLGCAACGAHPVSARDTTTETDPQERLRINSGNRQRHHRKTTRFPEGSDIAYRPQTLDILGDRWSTLILGAAFLRVRTFAGFKAALDIAPSVLASRLRRFVEHDVFTVVRQPGRRGHEYRLTEKGLSFFAVFAFMNEWAQAWISDDDNPADLVMTHVCGRRFVPALCCGACGLVLERRAVHFRSTP